MLNSLHLLAKAPTRTVLRITLIKGMNMAHAEEWAGLIWMADPDFVEFKAYMHIGHSQFRMKRENMPTFQEVKDFAGLIDIMLGEFEYMDEDEPSRIVVLKNRRRKTRRFIKGPMPADNGF